MTPHRYRCPTCGDDLTQSITLTTNPDHAMFCTLRCAIRWDDNHDFDQLHKSGVTQFTPQPTNIQAWLTEPQ